MIEDDCDDDGVVVCVAVTVALARLLLVNSQPANRPVPKMIKSTRLSAISATVRFGSDSGAGVCQELSGG